MVDDPTDDGAPPATEPVRPVADLPPRPPWPDEPPVAREDDTEIIVRAPAHRRPRNRRVPVIAAGVAVVALVLGTYPIWRADAGSAALPPVVAPLSPRPSTSSPEPEPTRSTGSPAPRPIATRRVEPSRSIASPTTSTSASRPPFAPAASSTPPPPAPPVPGPIVGLAGKCADNNGQVTANGNRIQLFACNGTVAQVWTVERDGTFRVQGKCLRAAGTRTELWDCDGGPGELWRSTPGGLIVEVASGLCLDVAGAQTFDGTPLDIAPCTGADNQRWHLP